MPLANAFLSDARIAEDRYPLDLVRCRACGLVQITETIDPELLFRDYAYFSSYSETFVNHARAFARRATCDLGLGRESLVVEAASNDGYLLQFFVQEGIPVLGIEPAYGVAREAESRGVDTLPAFLTPGLARSIIHSRGTADLVVANNVMAHVADPGGFVESLKILAGDNGVVSIEVPYLRDLLERLEFDTIYHEHLCYFSLTSLAKMLERNGLRVWHVERLPVHGGSLRVLASSDETREASTSVGVLIEEEQQWGVNSHDPYGAFADGVRRLRASIHEMVTELAASGATIAGYGAAAKATVMTNFCDLDSGLIEFVVDRNPHKQGKLVPGSRIPIREPEALVHARPDYCILFAWNVADEVIAQQASYRAAGGRFIIPIPEPRIVAP